MLLGKVSTYKVLSRPQYMYVCMHACMLVLFIAHYQGLVLLHRSPQYAISISDQEGGVNNIKKKSQARLRMSREPCGFAQVFVFSSCGKMDQAKSGRASRCLGNLSVQFKDRVETLLVTLDPKWQGNMPMAKLITASKGINYMLVLLPTSEGSLWSLAGRSVPSDGTAISALLSVSFFFFLFFSLFSW